MLSEQILVSFNIKGSGLMQWSRQLIWYKFFNYSTCIIMFCFNFYILSLVIMSSHVVIFSFCTKELMRVAGNLLWCLGIL